MKTLIINRLKALEKTYKITILYACESGSRAWGFASPNSDWDVRFIYVHTQDWYLSINEQKDSMDFAIDQNDLDLSGWELRKTLGLLSSSNASPFEWLQSPIVYLDPYRFRSSLSNLFPVYFKPRSTAFHYLGLAKSSMKKGLINGQMDIKKYFYVLRPLLAAYWICHKNSIPPMEFAPLLEQLKDNRPLYSAIKELVIQKKAALEGDFTSPIPLIQAFIDYQLNACGLLAKNLEAKQQDNEPLNRLFREFII
ncbi:nucleotidyltransferase domain-containing protein [Aureispira anguillae]|uniref:Nucleotidyltransferase domain-containing protein n=1 Tax=Aureispira anguillae TaxID=2864201 RepID=A0A915YIR4_9BACT|nr:nucleotidyltransferase domain-containing protein [Aureispira anguillae]BDS13800.1 nucleotidyltransferase domain-containing protein [Aureispira anguillae]